jgi:hypothetical protein
MVGRECVCGGRGRALPLSCHHSGRWGKCLGSDKVGPGSVSLS